VPDVPVCDSPGETGLISDPPSWHFSVYYVKSADKEIRIRNDSSEPLHIVRIDWYGLQPGEFELVAPPATPIDLAPCADFGVTVRVPPGPIGLAAARLQIIYDPGSRMLEIPLDAYRVPSAKCVFRFLDRKFGLYVGSGVTSDINDLTNGGGGRCEVLEYGIQDCPWQDGDPFPPRCPEPPGEGPSDFFIAAPLRDPPWDWLFGFEQWVPFVVAFRSDYVPRTDDMPRYGYFWVRAKEHLSGDTYYAMKPDDLDESGKPIRYANIWAQ
jgi:hypothetical protein